MNTDQHVTIYTANSSLTSPRKLLGEMFSDLVACQGLAWRLAIRDISAQYRQSFLGILWAFILPLANTLTWIFLNSSGIIKLSDTGMSYPFYVFTGTMLWAVFMDAFAAPLQQVNAARGMLNKLNFPREALIVSGVYKTFFNAVIKAALLIVAMFFVDVNPGMSLIFFPIGLVSLMLLGTVLGLLITPVGVLYTDVGRGMPLLMQFVMYATPVVYPMPKDGWVELLVSLNPLTPVIITSRNWLSGQMQDFLMPFMLVNAVAVVVLVIVWGVYRLSMPILIERMNA